MLVKLTYFKTSGKYYSECTYISNKDSLFGIWDEVKRRKEAGCLWGLVSGHSSYHILVDVPNHPHEHPHLILAN